MWGLLKTGFSSENMNGTTAVFDRGNRPMKDLRISVTDRCNFRCTYCMPDSEYAWIERKNILSFEEIVRLWKIFKQDFGVQRLRLTGGEPLMRRGLDKLIRQLGEVHLRPMKRLPGDPPHEPPIDLSKYSTSYATFDKPEHSTLPSWLKFKTISTCC